MRKVFGILAMVAGVIWIVTGLIYPIVDYAFGFHLTQLLGGWGTFFSAVVGVVPLGFILLMAGAALFSYPR